MGSGTAEEKAARKAARKAAKAGVAVKETEAAVEETAKKSKKEKKKSKKAKVVVEEEVVEHKEAPQEDDKAARKAAKKAAKAKAAADAAAAEEAAAASSPVDEKVVRKAARKAAKKAAKAAAAAAAAANAGDGIVAATNNGGEFQADSTAKLDKAAAIALHLKRKKRPVDVHAASAYRVPEGADPFAVIDLPETHVAKKQKTADGAVATKTDGDGPTEDEIIEKLGARFYARMKASESSNLIFCFMYSRFPLRCLHFSRFARFSVHALCSIFAFFSLVYTAPFFARRVLRVLPTSRVCDRKG
jgi:hypothetical protein